ncbi:MAG TPA: glycosyltransferase family 2 protein, partial [Ktedonobacteraceae bacterium]|nr:glycosyltransferase family 2 protein [Ktedonobacteraceae bacterium]
VFQILRWLLLAAEIVIAVPIFYLCLLSLSAAWETCRRSSRQRRLSAEVADRYYRIAILIPAHNEELIINTLLKSLAALDYPVDRYLVCLVADNCTDQTAELARAFKGVRVYERFDQTNRGKGYALNWIIQELEGEKTPYEAYVVLDADSVVEPAFLHLLNRELATGAQALQASNTVLNTTDSPSTALRWIALSLMNHVRPLGRNGLGASSTLTGNGMCLRRSLLLRYPWQAFSTGEDYQYYLTLVENGERVRYVPEAVVRSQMPIRFDQMRTQDIRWEATDDSQSARQRVPTLLRAGLKARDFVRLEAAMEVLVPPLSFLVVACSLLLVASFVLWSALNLWISLVLIVGLLAYIGSAFYLLRPPLAVYRAILYAPGFVVWKLWVYLVLRRNPRYTGAWVRTERTPHEVV